MAEKQSEASPFQSRFGGGWVSAAQYLAETMCARMAKKRNQDLPPFFWNQVAWKRTFLIQIRHANALLKLYDRKAIFAALRRARWVMSLTNKMTLDPLFQEEQDKLDAQAAAQKASPPPAPTPPATPVTTKPREVYNPEQSQYAKLRSIDEKDMER